jgi:NADH dehydrogenase FAD-containing subunit
MAALPHVIIVGAGFGGLEAAKALAHAPVDVIAVMSSPIASLIAFST